MKHILNRHHNFRGITPPLHSFSIYKHEFIEFFRLLERVRQLCCVEVITFKTRVKVADFNGAISVSTARFYVSNCVLVWERQWRQLPKHLFTTEKIYIYIYTLSLSPSLPLLLSLSPSLLLSLPLPHSLSLSLSPSLSLSLSPSSAAVSVNTNMSTHNVKHFLVLVIAI